MHALFSLCSPGEWGLADEREGKAKLSLRSPGEWGLADAVHGKLTDTNICGCNLSWDLILLSLEIIPGSRYASRNSGIQGQWDNRTIKSKMYNSHLGDWKAVMSPTQKAGRCNPRCGKRAPEAHRGLPDSPDGTGAGAVSLMTQPSTAHPSYPQNRCHCSPHLPAVAIPAPLTHCTSGHK